ncbi:MAG: hypothetical protein GY804_13365 [Alphaproteobacteria bacterium]|nr:hypothetical protein [Alphaproteobacteria bacterium]
MFDRKSNGTVRIGAGRTVIEMLVLLAVVVGVGLVVLTEYSQARTRQKVSEAVDEIINIISNIQDHYIDNKDYSNLNYKMLIQEEIFPSDLKNIFAIPMSVQGASVDMKPAIKLNYTVPSAAICKGVMLAGLDRHFSKDLAQISVWWPSIGRAENISWSGSTHQFPVAVGVANYICREDGSGENKTLMLYIR